MNCKHGKQVATKVDLDSYNARLSCAVKGDCRCMACSSLCWDGQCLPPNRETGEVKKAEAKV